MVNNQTKQCILLGSKSLLIQCATYLQDNNFKIVAVVTDDSVISNWASGESIKIVSYGSYNEILNLTKIDYIFSITNLRIVPESILKLANKAAINFHDGPLPGYAGLNVTTWALANQETKHAVTWHEMLAEVDTGRLYKTESIDIDDRETAFTLNAKCYEVALNLFKQIVNDINADNLQSVAQDSGESHFYAKCHRMPAVEILDWQRTASELDAMVRALDYGPYENPLGVAKLVVHDQVTYVKEVSVADMTSLPAGECLIQDAQIFIGCATGAVKLEKIISLNGEPLASDEFIEISGLKSGELLSPPDKNIIPVISELDHHYCKNESAILSALVRFKAPEIPYAKTVQDAEGEIQIGFKKQKLSSKAEKAVEKFTNKYDVCALFAVYVFKISAMDSFGLGVNLERKKSIADLLFASTGPIVIDVDGQEKLNNFIKAKSELIEQVVTRGGVLTEISLCRPELNGVVPDFPLQITNVPSIESYQPESINGLRFVTDDSNNIAWIYDARIYDEDNITAMQSQFDNLLQQIEGDDSKAIAEYGLISEIELDKLLNQWNKTDLEMPANKCVHQLFEEQVRSQPDSIAVSFSGHTSTYRELNNRANQIANYLIELGVKPDRLVGVLVDRSIDMIAAMLGVLKSGGAYLPLDPTYPKERISYMLEDADVSAVISQSDHSAYLLGVEAPALYLDTDDGLIRQQPEHLDSTTVAPTHLAYTIYTSGSTGKPKGVMVEHRNVINFFSGMDQQLGTQKGVWLAVTSISFDISVLELFWTLANGFEIALYADQERKVSKKVKTRYPDQDMQFSLFYWNVADDESDYDEDKYNLLIESAKFGDRNNFKAVWTPERHFHAFGGLYPNPSITSAALATITTQIEIRAGSCVAPLHHPIRIAEEWAMVDNLSHGRVGMAVAAGWQPNDFVIMPDNHADAKNIMFETVETVKKLWRGETLEFPGPKGNMVKVRTLPRPVQKELPIWVTTAGNPETFRQAGEVGAYILTHLLGQSVDDVAKNIDVYRQAYKGAGHEGDGHVTLLLHTLVGSDEGKVRELAREPMKNYLKSAVFLVKAAAWHFPTFKTMSEERGQTLDQIFDNMGEEDLDGLLEFAFERYYSTSGLFGTPERCVELVDRLKEIGVNEIGCLIDYGLDTQNVLAHLPNLNDLRKASIKQDHQQAEETKELSIADIISSRQVSHLQCTPSMASMLVSEDASANGLKKIKHMMVGGEAFPPSLASKLRQLINGRVTNMYGPTETTIWSSTYDVPEGETSISIGKPIANTQMYILDQYMQPVPVGIPGELYIGGDSVVRGYHAREDITAERFVKNPFSNKVGARIYKTGDLVKYREDGSLEYISRIDNQVKIRGYRIELGEIESLLQSHSSISEAIVLLREDIENDKRLVAYIKLAENEVFDTNVIKGYLKNDLPEFMVPGIFVEITAMPLTPNGKVDRKALPPPEQELKSTSNKKYVQPENDLQKSIATIWQDILGLAQVGLEDNFFDIGGHSLLVVQVLDKLRTATDVQVKMIDMFRFPTISSLSKYLGQTDDAGNKLDESKGRAEARKSAMLKRRKSRK